MLTGNLNLNFLYICNPHLRIKYYHISLPQNQIPVRDHDSFLTFYKHDDGMSGDIQIPDALSVPRIILLQDDLFEPDMFFILKGFCRQNHYVILTKDKIPLWYKRAVIA